MTELDGKVILQTQYLSLAPPDHNCTISKPKFNQKTSDMDVNCLSTALRTLEYSSVFSLHCCG